MREAEDALLSAVDETGREAFRALLGRVARSALDTGPGSRPCDADADICDSAATADGAEPGRPAS